MQEKILQLKKLNAAYIAALEYDYCPESSEVTEVDDLLETGITKDILEQALIDNQGRRPDEIAGKMSDVIKTL